MLIRTISIYKLIDNIQVTYLTLRKSNVSALTVSACNFFPPASPPVTTPIPLASDEAAAGVGAGAAGAIVV